MKITKRELHRLLGEAKKKPKTGTDDAPQKTRPDGYTDLPAFMTINKQSPAKYSGFHADDPAVVDPLGDDIDAGALKTVRRLQARGEDKKKDKKLKEGAMSVTRKDIRRLVNEALDEMSMMGGQRGMRRQRPGMCLYVAYGGMAVFYYVAPCGMPEAAAVEVGRDVTSELDLEGQGMADALTLYSWLQDHDEITHVHDEESAGGTVPKQMYMNQVREVGQEEGLFAPDGMVNEGDEPLDETDDLDEMTDDAYNDDLQSRHGRFTSPENVKGTPQHRAAHGPYVSDRRGAPSTPMGPASAEELERIRARLAGSPPQPFNTHYGPNSPDSPYYDLREGAFPEEIEGVYGEEPPELDDDMDYEDYEDDSWMDYETGEDDVPYGAADVAFRMGRGYRTDEGEAAPVNEARWAKLAGILKG